MNSEQLNATRLAQIKERAEKATPGYWFADSHEWDGNKNLRYWTNSSALMGDGLCASVTKADAEFIAHAREDIPQLVAEVERLSRGRGISALQIRQLFGEVARLKQALRTARQLSEDSDMVIYVVNEALKDEEESE